jgi:hypothetical protein
LAQAGDEHRPYNLDEADVANSREAFAEVPGKQCGGVWRRAAACAWRRTFDRPIIPLMTKGHAR